MQAIRVIVQCRAYPIGRAEKDSAPARLGGNNAPAQLAIGGKQPAGSGATQTVMGAFFDGLSACPTPTESVIKAGLPIPPIQGPAIRGFQPDVPPGLVGVGRADIFDQRQKAILC